MDKNRIDDRIWKRSGVQLSRHFADSTSKLREAALSRDDYDPARLFKWGQMMALAVVRMMEGTEKTFGAKGQEVMNHALVDLGRQIGREVLNHYAIAPGTKEIEAISKFVTYINEEVWASPEIPRVLSDTECVCDVLWCPHQDHYKPFDCRVQRYIVQGLLEAFQEKTGIVVDARFTQIIPKGAETCRFEVRVLPKGEGREWTRYSSDLAQRALKRVSDDSSRKER
jgi:predicted hydrocarbon binding protein